MYIYIYIYERANLSLQREAGIDKKAAVENRILFIPQ
jgi:hypothetical protein